MVYRFVLVCLKHTTNNLSLPGSPVGLVFSELHAVMKFQHGNEKQGPLM